jgi:hypothetical protein
MKKTSTLFVAILLALNGFAQTFDIPLHVNEDTYPVTNYPSDYIHIYNNTGSSIDLSYELVENTFPDNNWSATICTHEVCLPSIPQQGSFSSMANGSSGFLNLHSSFDGNTGTGIVSYRIYETSNPSNSDTVTFVIHAVSPNGIEDNNGVADVQIFPNPTSDVLNIQGVDISKDLTAVLTDLNGKLVLQQNLISSNSNIWVADLPKAIYTLELKNGSRSLLSSRIVKL